MEKVTLKIEKTHLWDGSIKAFRWLIFIGAFVSLVVMCASVFMRYVLHMDFFGYEDVEMFFMIWLYYLGAAYASYDESHVKGDMMSFLFKSPKAKKFYYVSIYAFIVFVLAFWLKWGFDYAKWNFIAGGTTSALKIPLFVTQIALYVGIVGMFFYSVIHLIKYIKTKPEAYITKEDENIVI